MSDQLTPDPGNGGDSITEVTTTGWLQRLGQSLGGAVIGLLLVIGSVVLLWWNEGRAVEASRALGQGARQVVEAKASAVDPRLNGKLVHLSGMLETRAPAHDGAFGVGGGTLVRLKRTVEMFQWVEEESSTSHKNLGGSETTRTTYSYHKEWRDYPVDSSRFHAAANHHNPAMPVRSETFDSPQVRVGAYRVDRGLLAQVSGFTPYQPHAAALPQGYRATGDMLYRGADPANPAIGDIRIRYSAVPAETMSFVAAQVSGILAPFRAANGYTIALAEPGSVPAAAMFRDKERAENVWTWILRGVGFALMLFGFLLMARPLTVLVGVVPLFEEVAEMGAFLVALLLALPLTLFVIALAWIAHRPLIGVGLIAAGVALAWLLRRLHRRPARGFLPAGR